MTEELEINLKKRPKWGVTQYKKPTRKQYEDWFERFEKKLKGFLSEDKLDEWLEKNILEIMQRFHLHSVSGVMPKELLHFFIETEILGETKK